MYFDVADIDTARFCFELLQRPVSYWLLFLGWWLYVESLEDDEIERLIDVVSVHCIPDYIYV